MKKRILAVILLALCLVGSFVIPASAYYPIYDMGMYGEWKDENEDEHTLKYEINGG